MTKLELKAQLEKIEKSEAEISSSYATPNMAWLTFKNGKTAQITYRNGWQLDWIK